MPEGIARLGSLMLDVNDLEREQTFWGAMLGIEPASADDRYVWFAGFALQKVTEAKTGKNRAHPDLAVDDLDQAIESIQALGASLIEPPPSEGFRWAVMADPEGNEFCISEG